MSMEWQPQLWRVTRRVDQNALAIVFLVMLSACGSGGGGNSSSTGSSSVGTTQNTSPTAQSLSVSMDDDTILNSSVLTSDSDGDAITVTKATEPTNGTVVVNTDGTFAYTPRRQYSGVDEFQIRATDSKGASATAMVSITVRPTGPQYQGPSATVQITESNATNVASTSWNLFTLVARIANSLPRDPLPGGAVDVIVSDGKGGHMHVTGTLTAQSTGTLEVEHTNFSLLGLKLNGREIIDITQTRTANTGKVRRTFKAVTFSTPELSGTLNGSIELTDTATGSSNLPYVEHLTGNLTVLRDDGTLLQLADAVLDEAPRSTSNIFLGLAYGWSGQARILDSRFGAATLAPDAPVLFLPVSIQTTVTTPVADINRAIGRASLTATGSAASKLWVTPLSPDYLSVEVDAQGTGTPTKALAFRKADHFEHSVGFDTNRMTQAVTAYPFDATYVQIGGTFYPEGRFSEQGQGKYLTHQWSIEVAPPGSTAQLVGANTPRPRLTADAAGNYLLRLDVSDGTNHSTDYLTLQSVAQGQAPGFPTPNSFERQIVGADEAINPNTEVVLDGRKAYGVYYSSQNDYIWTVYSDVSGPQALTSNGLVARFTPTTPGVYTATLVTRNNQPVMHGSKRIFVAPSRRFAPHVRFAEVGTDTSRVADMNGDGRMDILQPTGNSFVVFRGNTLNRFDAGIDLGDIRSSNQQVLYAFEDLTGDNRREIIAYDFQGRIFSVATQLADGHFATAVTLDDGPNPCPSGFLYGQYIGAIDLNGDGRKDVVRSGGCDPSPSWISVNYSLPAGGFGVTTPVTVSPAASIAVAEVADIDGDGKDDIIGANVAVSNTSIYVLKQMNGQFVSSTITVPPFVAYFIQARDMNGDGRTDIVAGQSPTLVLTQNSDGTFTKRGEFPGYLTGAKLNVVDLDGDGRLDVLLPDPTSSGNPLWYRQQSNGSYLLVPNALGPQGTPFLDINGDGLPDNIGYLSFMRLQTPP